MKNFEKIQAMTIEELAEVIKCPNEFLDTEIRCNKFDMYAFPRTCRECKKSWLQEGEL